MLFFLLFFCSESVPHVGWHCHMISIFTYFSDAFRESKTAWNFAFLESSAQNNLNSVAQPIWLRHWFLSPRIHSVRVFFPEEWAGGGLFSTRKAQLKIAQYLKKSEDYFCLRRYGNIRKLGRRKQTDCAKRNSVQSQRLHLHVIEHMYVERSLRLEVQVHTTFFQHNLNTSWTLDSDRYNDAKRNHDYEALQRFNVKFNHSLQRTKHAKQNCVMTYEWLQDENDLNTRVRLSFLTSHGMNLWWINIEFATNDITSTEWIMNAINSVNSRRRVVWIFCTFSSCQMETQLLFGFDFVTEDSLPMV